MKDLDRDIRRLALPALGALVAEPLFLLTDTALVGHLGATPLAGLGIASVVLQTVVGLLVFLAYATTPMVARRLGFGDTAGAVRAGIDGVWLALAVGALLVLVGVPSSGWLVSLFGATPDVTEAATVYLSISLWGVPALLLTLAASGLLRGLQNTRTPLVVAGAGFGANAVLNAVLIYGAGWGIAGSAIGTVVASWGMAAAYLVIIVRAARSSGATLTPHVSGIASALRSGGWLLLRTASLRVALLATVFVATGFGTAELAATQIALTLFSTLAFVLDALAIAGQAMIGHGLGASDVPRVRAITRRLLQFGVVGGAGLGLLIAALSPVLPLIFTTDDAVVGPLVLALLVMAVGVPLAGYAFVLDGVLIGAGDARYLAVAGILNLVVYLPLLGAVVASGATGGAAVALLWAAFGLGYMGSRALTLGLRARTDRWMVVGA
ncbi:putative MATE family efflux protein [Conyzicola lurida]|uniref:Putative MATE family efflux protein n=1 Tax=Conyzicola lurida TaxID=1172621 RepID=A0A841ALK7_9MICO|nr:MATE family efflux transporter [Conyzicola lurida]MBB5844870.1 putative MATE family efflux protein [Conyzicola lurida]